MENVFRVLICHSGELNGKKLGPKPKHNAQNHDNGLKGLGIWSCGWSWRVHVATSGGRPKSKPQTLTLDTV